MYDQLVQWIGSKTCKVAGNLTDVLEAGQACASGQAVNMGFVVLGIAAVAIVVMLINERRRYHRDNFFRR